MTEKQICKCGHEKAYHSALEHDVYSIGQCQIDDCPCEKFEAVRVYPPDRTEIEMMIKENEKPQKVFNEKDMNKYVKKPQKDVKIMSKTELFNEGLIPQKGCGKEYDSFNSWHRKNMKIKCGTNYFNEKILLCPACENHSPQAGELYCKVTPLEGKVSDVSSIAKGVDASGSYNLSEERKKLIRLMVMIKKDKISMGEVLMIIEEQDKEFIRRRNELDWQLRKRLIDLQEYLQERDKLAGKNLSGDGE